MRQRMRLDDAVRGLRPAHRLIEHVDRRSVADRAQHRAKDKGVDPAFGDRRRVEGRRPAKQRVRGRHDAAVDELQFSEQTAGIGRRQCRLEVVAGDVALGRFVVNDAARQFKSDGSTERVKRFRERERNAAASAKGDVSSAVPETGGATGPEQNRADTEQSRADAPPAANEFEQLQAALAKSLLCDDLRKIFGPSRCADLARVDTWLGKGYAPAMIIEVVKELLARKSDVSSLKYFDAALAERHARRAESPSQRAAARAAIDMEKVVSMWVKTGVWSKYAGPEPGLGGCRASAELLAKHGLDERGVKIRKVG